MSNSSSNNPVPSIRLPEGGSKAAFLYVACHYDEKRLPVAPIKIGVTTNPQRRLQDLQTGNPGMIDFYIKLAFETEQSAYRAERDLHFCFEEDGLAGEWFDVDPAKVIGIYIQRSIFWREHVIEQYKKQNEYHWSYLTMGQIKSIIIEKFMALHKDGWALYEKFNGEAKANPNISEKMPSWWLSGEDKDTEPHQQDVLVSLLKLHNNTRDAR